MSLIFDQFKSREDADKFALDMQERFGLETRVFATEEEAFAHDPFPYDLVAPIVHVERTEYEREAEIGRAVPDYGGVWAGT